MGYREIELSMPTDYSEDMLHRGIGKAVGTGDFTYVIQKKSLDARRKGSIQWKIRVLAGSEKFRGPGPQRRVLEIPRKKRDERILVVGSGPAGFFSAFVLQTAGYAVTLIERGLEVNERAEGIRLFEETGRFADRANYAYGEGGAGTFSDGKLTSRTKSIRTERDFIFDAYIRAGAPEEIAYLTHPHLGTDNLKEIVAALRMSFEDLGGEVLFDTTMIDLTVRSGRVTGVETHQGILDCDYLFVAPGHSAYDTYRMLMRTGVRFRNKNFALGCRVEHPREIINHAQWGTESLPGIKAAEYRLTARARDGRPVYTFCMCPGGRIVPATAWAGRNIVNGMSFYARDERFSNAACVAGIRMEELTGRETTPEESLNHLDALERAFFDVSADYRAPGVPISGFLRRKACSLPGGGSYPLGMIEYPLWELLPPMITEALSQGLTEFSGKLKGFDTGIILGLESKTSAPIQVLRDEFGKAEGFSNLFIVGEGSGYAGGIVSSASDGIRAAMSLVRER